MGGTTKLDRYRHQYFVSLEVYALQSASRGRTGSKRSASTDDDGGDDEPDVVGRRVSRSTMFLVVTGNPPTRTQRTSARDWLVSITHTEQTQRADPLNRFSSGVVAADKVVA